LADEMVQHLWGVMLEARGELGQEPTGID